MKFKRILHLSIDDLRFDALSISPNKNYLKKYGLDQLPNTPNLDFFAKEGTFFTRTYSTAPFTPPSHTSMLTGTYQNKHSVRPFLGTKLSDSVKTIFEHLKENNFYTISAIDFNDVFELNNILRGSDEIIVRNDQKVIDYLAKRKNENVYLFMHIGDVHPPYGESFYPPDEKYNESFYEDYEQLANSLGISFEPFRNGSGKVNRENLITLSNKVRIHCEENLISDAVQLPRYLKGINKFDSGRFKKLIDNLKLNNLLNQDTLLIITSDHGQAIINPEKMVVPKTNTKLMKFDHGETVIEEIIRVPLIFYSPIFKNNCKSSNSIASLVDIVPTILDFTELDYKGVDGCSLKTIILSNQELQEVQRMNRAVYAEAWFHDRKELSSYLKKSAKLSHLPNESYFTFLFQQTTIKDKFKLVRTNQTADSKVIKDELFNIDCDLDESFNLLKTLNLPRYISSWDLIKDVYADLKNELEKFNKVSSEIYKKDSHSVYETKEDIELIEERLRALGYVE